MNIHVVTQTWGSCREDMETANVKAFSDPLAAAGFIEMLKAKDLRKKEIATALQPRFFAFTKEQIYPRSAELAALMRERNEKPGVVKTPEWRSRHDTAVKAQSIELADWLAARQAFIITLLTNYGCTEEERSWFAVGEGDRTLYAGFIVEDFTYGIDVLELV